MDSFDWMDSLRAGHALLKTINDPRIRLMYAKWATCRFASKQYQKANIIHEKAQFSPAQLTKWVSLN